MKEDTQEDALPIDDTDQELTEEHERTITTLRGNKVNDLSAKEHADFITIARPMPRTSKEDLKVTTDSASIPSTALEETLLFFTKENDEILDVFSGEGRMLSVAAHSNRRAQGIELLQSKIDTYHSLGQEDMFAEPMPVIQGDALDTLHNLAATGAMYDFIFIDPPRPKWQSAPKQTYENPVKGDLAQMAVDDYLTYLVDLMPQVCRVLKPDHFVALALDDVFYKGVLYHTVGLLQARLLQIPTIPLRMRILKVWYFHKGTQLGNLGIVAASINATYLVAFENTTECQTSTALESSPTTEVNLSAL